jgi:predicted nucleic acid-binding protein
VTPIVVLDASAATEMFAQTALGYALLGLAPAKRIWWVPDHFHVETTGAIRRMLQHELIAANRAAEALNRLLAFPVAVAQSDR